MSCRPVVQRTVDPQGADRLRRRHPGHGGGLPVLPGPRRRHQGGFSVVAPNNIYQLPVSGGGWIHLILGIVLAVTGFFIHREPGWGSRSGHPVRGRVSRSREQCTCARFLAPPAPVPVKVAPPVGPGAGRRAML